MCGFQTDWDRELSAVQRRQRVTELIPAEEVQQRVEELARLISRDFAGKDLLMIGILKGAKVFVEALVNKMEIKPSVDFVTAKSYASSTESGGRVDVDFHVKEPIEGRHVLVVDDVADTGLTFNEVCQEVSKRKPASLKTCVLCDKAARRTKPVKLDYVGFFVPNRFLVGFGMGYRGLYRDLPYIGFI